MTDSPASEMNDSYKNSLVNTDSPSNTEYRPSMKDTLNSDKMPSDDSEHLILVFGKPSSVHTMCLIMFLVVTIITILPGFQQSLIFELQEQGATLSEQSYFSIVNYPLLFRLIMAPIVDLYFFKTVGKCRTYLLASGIVVTLGMFGLSFKIGSLLDHSNLTPLIVCLFTINFFLAFGVIATQSLLVKAFPLKVRAKAGMVLNLGSTLGQMIGLNFYVPLSSKKWVSTYVWGMKGKNEAILNDSSMFLILGILNGFLVLLIGLVVQEKLDPSLPTDSETEGETGTEAEKKHTLCSLLKYYPKFLMNPTTKKFFYVIACRNILGNLYQEAMTLKYLNGGFDKTTLVNIRTFLAPAGWFFGWYLMRFLQKGKLMKVFIWLSVGGIVIFLLEGINLWYLESGTRSNFSKDEQETTRDYTLIFLYILSFFSSAMLGDIFLISFMDQMTPPEISSTYLSFYYSWASVTSIIPQSIGLKMMDLSWLPWQTQILGCTLGQAGLLAGFTKYYRSLDKAEPKDFDIRRGQYTCRDCCSGGGRGLEDLEEERESVKESYKPETVLQHDQSGESD